MTGTLLLVQTENETLAIRFPSVAAARDWEDEHEMDMPGTIIGTARVVSMAEALRG